MQKYLNKQAIDFSVPMADEQGDSVAVSKVTWTLFSEKLEVIREGELTPLDDQEVSIIKVSAEDCEITNNQTTEVRQLQVTLTYDGKETTNNEYFLLEKSQTVIPAVNSFVTYLEALRMLPDFPQFNALNTATESEIKSGLIAAFRNIGTISFATGTFQDLDKNDILNEDGDRLWTTHQLTPENFSTLDEQVKKNFMYAQMEEAEYVLGGDGTEDLRSKGVLSYTTGEVKSFFRTKKPLDLAVSKHALRYVGRYIQYNRTLSRV